MWGTRQYHYQFPDGRESLVVAVLYREGDEEWQEVLRIPGDQVARIRGLLQAVEAAHPALVGTGLQQLTQTQTFKGRGPDPRKVTEN